MRNEYCVKAGSISTYGNKIIVNHQSTLAINKNINNLILSKMINGNNIEIIKKKSEVIYHVFDKRNTYKLTINIYLILEK